MARARRDQALPNEAAARVRTARTGRSALDAARHPRHGAAVTQHAPIRAATGPAQPRSIGAMRVASMRAGGRSRLRDLRQAGCLKCLVPRPTGPALQGVMANTSGGLTSGDGLRVEAEAAAGSALTVTTQACERLYRAPSGPAALDVSLTVGPAAALRWLPQETIAYDGAALRRRIDAQVAGDGVLLICEAVILGRTARGERVGSLDLSERWHVRRDGRLVHVEAQRLGPPASLDAPSLLGGARAFATVLHVAPDAARRLPAMRAALEGAHGAAGAWDGKAVARILAPDGRALRRALIPLLRALAPLPRVWTL